MRTKKSIQLAIVLIAFRKEITIIFTETKNQPPNLVASNLNITLTLKLHHKI